MTGSGVHAAPNTGPTYQTLLVPLDGSAIAPRVFMSAVHLARMLGAKIQLLHVLEIEPALPPAGHVIPDGLEAKLVAEGRADLEKWMASVKDVAFGPPQIAIGDPWRRILQVATEVGADMIVIGSHRYHGADRILGTVAAKVVNHADCDVLVIHHDRAARAGAATKP